MSSSNRLSPDTERRLEEFFGKEIARQLDRLRTDVNEDIQRREEKKIKDQRRTSRRLSVIAKLLASGLFVSMTWELCRGYVMPGNGGVASQVQKDSDKVKKQPTTFCKKKSKKKSRKRKRRTSFATQILSAVG